MWDYVRDAAVTWFIGFFPLFEIYIAVPAGIALGLGAASAVFWSVFGNYTPVLLIEFGYERLMRVEKVRNWLERRRSARFERSVNRYGPWFVLLITPWTGVWVMATTAKVLGMNRRALLGYSFVSVLAYGVALAYGAERLIESGIGADGSLDFNVDGIQIVVILLIVYALTYGKRDFQRLTEWFKRRGSDGAGGRKAGAAAGARVEGGEGRPSARGTPVAQGEVGRETGPSDEPESEGRVAAGQPAYDWERARKERVWLYRHAAVFVAVHIVAFVIDWLAASAPIASLVESWRERGMTGILPFYTPALAEVSRGWTTVLIIHAIVALSYTVFPKRKREEGA